MKCENLESAEKVKIVTLYVEGYKAATCGHATS